jgi:DNA-directed DNA polymerase III PolC
MSTYVELDARSAFSFLEAASSPEALAERAAALGAPALALLDVDGLYGAVRFHQAATAAGVRPLVGAALTLADGARLPLLVETAEGYRRLCRLLTRVKLGAAKGTARARWDDLEGETRGLVCLTGGADGPLVADLRAGRRDAARRTLERLVGLFGRRQVYVQLQRQLTRESELRGHRLGELAEALGLPCVATNGVRYATPAERLVLDVFTAVRHGTTLDAAGRRLEPNLERWLKPPAEMARLFADHPAALAETAELAGRLRFTLKDLGYRFPDYPVPDGRPPIAYLRELVEAGARERYRPVTERVRTQLARELALIEKLGLAGYFLIVWDIVRECRARGILVQGRGSAANSAVCYSLGITAVDPVGMDLLFERFLSEERGEWPDIDLDLPSGDRREAIIQHVYDRYGRTRAAMTANVITYQPRRAAREVGKVLGFPPELLDRLAKFVPDWGYRDPDDQAPARHLGRVGLDPAHPRVRRFAELWARVQGLPRHLGQHSGGMVLCAGRLDEIVPLEPATMPGRTVVQWDKDDCADTGIIKVDLLGLGMMAVLEDALVLCREAGHAVDLAHLPPDDPRVYAALQKADTVGVFQVESRAQMATLPRLRPERFYDLVVEVAIIRPGPIVGDMVHPYLARRAGRAPVSYPHPSLAPILERTLGVPLFQEQLLRMAMVAAGFTGGEAEELRRALGFRRSEARMRAVETKLRAGIARNGISGEAAEEIVRSITSFAEYGFPECVSGETWVLDADTGRRVRIEDVAAGRVRLEHTVACGPDQKLRRRRVLGATASGRRMVYRLRTALGREILATWEHPLLTLDGWRALGSLHVGDRIAAARRLPTSPAKRWSPHRLIVLADLLAEGNLCHPTTMYFYTTDPRHRDEFVDAVERFANTRATVARHRSCYSVHVRRRRAAGRAGALDWAEALGIRRLAAGAKRVPAEVFALRAADVALLLARLWEGDGCLSGRGHASYDTASRQLAEDVQHLLLRLGIVARVYERVRRYRDRQVTGYVVTVTGRENLVRFHQRVGLRFLDPGRRRAARVLAGAGGPTRSSRDVVPAGVQMIVDRERRRCRATWDDVSRGAGVATRELCSPSRSKAGYRRWVIRRLAGYFGSRELACLAESDLYWDRVTAIEPVGEQETYDLQVEGDHNFLANDLVVHNSHAASFALLAYASAYLKVHHPAQFYAALLNNQPMGFYHPATLVKDAQRHGLTVRPVDVTRSDWPATVEDGALRLGLMSVKGVREAAARRLVAARRERPFASVDDLVARAQLSREELVTLAEIGALEALGLTRRGAVWEAERAARPPGPLWRGATPPGEPSPLPEMTADERLVADYRGTELTVGPHPLAYRRAQLGRLGVTPAAGLAALPDGRRVRIAGQVIVRQRPGTARGFVFLSLEDETGIANAIIRPALFDRDRAAIVHEPFLLVEGVLQHQDGVVSVRATRLRPLPPLPARVPSHDFH